MRKIVLLAGPAALLTACGEPKPGVYDIPLAEAMARLENADINGFRLARQCGKLIYFKKSRPADDTVAWRVTSGGEQVFRFSVKLTAEGEGTRATIDVPRQNKGEMYDGTQFYEYPALHQPIRPAIKELIDAAMAQRPYDVMQIPDEERNTGQYDGICSLQRSKLEMGHGPATAEASDSAWEDKERENRYEDYQLRDDASKFGQPMDRTGEW